MGTDILFINPGNQKRVYQELSREFTAIATPAWTCLLAGYARRQGFSAAIYDVNVDGWDDGVPAELAAKYQPRLIVMMVYGHQPSASTQTMPAARMILNDLKKCCPELPVAVGGTHPSALPERTLSEEKADYVIIGEGPATIKGLFNALKTGSALSGVPGLCWKEAGAIRVNERAGVIQDLDAELPDYAWDLLPDLGRYRAHNMHCFQDFESSAAEDFADVRTPYIAMNTSLGCPFSCDYCCINALFAKPGIRYWSVDTVMKWMDTAVNKHKVRNIRFDDELFILSPKRIEALCDRLIERDYGLNIWVYGRVDTIRDNLLGKLKRAGVNWICLGIESGDEAVRDGVNKRINRDIRDIVKSIQGHGIYVLGNYMFGLPDDTMETMRRTLDLAMALNCEFANFYCTMPYPGSMLYDQSEPGDRPETWAGYSQHGYDCKPLPTKHVSAAEVLRFRDRAFVEYFTNPAYLDMVDRRFGKKVRGHIEKMLKVTIKRKLLEEHS